MYTAAGSRMIIAIGVLAICLAAISPTVTWTAEPVKQEKQVKKPAKARASAPAPKSPAPTVAAPIVPAPIVPAPKFASAETAGKAPS